jgi:hypothetical protein
MDDLLVSCSSVIVSSVFYVGEFSEIGLGNLKVKQERGVIYNNTLKPAYRPCIYPHPLVSGGQTVASAQKTRWPSSFEPLAEFLDDPLRLVAHLCLVARLARQPSALPRSMAKLAKLRSWKQRSRSNRNK